MSDRPDAASPGRRDDAIRDQAAEREIVERYSQRLLAFARQRLPTTLRRRVDPEDLLQSVYRSFFLRWHDGQFTFQDSHDLWRLLASMTYQRVTKSIRFHQRQRRDVRREGVPLASEGPPLEGEHAVSPLPGPDDLAVLLESLSKLLAQLPERYRQIAVLQLHGYSAEEISVQVQRSRRTIYRALAELEQLAVKLLSEDDA